MFIFISIASHKLTQHIHFQSLNGVGELDSNKANNMQVINTITQIIKGYIQIIRVVMPIINISLQEFISFMQIIRNNMQVIRKTTQIIRNNIKISINYEILLLNASKKKRNERQIERRLMSRSIKRGYSCCILSIIIVLAIFSLIQWHMFNK
jgi:hypothetical protein